MAGGTIAFTFRLKIRSASFAVALEIATSLSARRPDRVWKTDLFHRVIRLGRETVDEVVDIYPIAPQKISMPSCCGSLGREKCIHKGAAWYCADCRRWMLGAWGASNPMLEYK